MLTVLAVKFSREDITLPIVMVNNSIFFPAMGVFWIFLIWVLWKIVQGLKCTATSLKSAEESLKEIAASLKNKG